MTTRLQVELFVPRQCMEFMIGNFFNQLLRTNLSALLKPHYSQEITCVIQQIRVFHFCSLCNPLNGLALVSTSYEWYSGTMLLMYGRKYENNSHISAMWLNFHELPYWQLRLYQMKEQAVDFEFQPQKSHTIQKRLSFIFSFINDICMCQSKKKKTKQQQNK